jgi:hypothetical protein
MEFKLLIIIFWKLNQYTWTKIIPIEIDSHNKVILKKNSLKQI